MIGKFGWLLSLGRRLILSLIDLFGRLELLVNRLSRLNLLLHLLCLLLCPALAQIVKVNGFPLDIAFDQSIIGSSCCRRPRFRLVPQPPLQDTLLALLDLEQIICVINRLIGN